VELPWHSTIRLGDPERPTYNFPSSKLNQYGAVRSERVAPDAQSTNQWWHVEERFFMTVTTANASLRCWMR